MQNPERPTLCVLCDAHADHLAHKETYLGAGTRYDRWECDRCNGQFWTPFKNPGASWYERDERYHDRNEDPILSANTKQRRSLAVLGGVKGPLLDIGCGVGNFLAYAREQGWKDVWGIDFDHDAIEAGKRTFNLSNLEVSDVGTFRSGHSNLSFAFVTFFDVFEHLDNHAAFLEEVRNLLTPGGHIALSVPYERGWRWLMPADLPPRHLTRWNETSLHSILNRNGFDVVHTGRLPASLYYLALKIRFRYGRWSSLSLVRRLEKKTTTTSTQAAAGGRRPLIRTLAKAKDLILFGLPALFLWLVLFPTRKRYTDLYVVARLR